MLRVHVQRATPLWHSSLILDADVLVVPTFLLIVKVSELRRQVSILVAFIDSASFRIEYSSIETIGLILMVWLSSAFDLD